jgi:hypothetical protein
MQFHLADVMLVVTVVQRLFQRLMPNGFSTDCTEVTTPLRKHQKRLGAQAISLQRMLLLKLLVTAIVTNSTTSSSSCSSKQL